MAGLKVLLLTTTGRKSGKRRTAPLGYFEHEGAYVITASNAGSDRHPAWFLNLGNHPAAELQIGDKKIAVTAHIVDPELRTKLWAKLVRISPHYAPYQEKAKRVIPMVLLEPEKVK